MCNELIGPKGETIVVYTTGTRYVWFTGWMRVHGMDEVDVMMNLRNIVGNWQGKPCYQTAPVLPEYPDGPTVFTDGSYETTAGFKHFRETLSLSGKYWIRIGVAASNTAGVAIGSADVEVQVAHARCSDQVGIGSITIHPGTFTGSDIAYFEIGGWHPTIGFADVMGAIAVLDNDSTYMEVQLVCRTAKDTRAPNSWQTCELAWDNPASGNSVRNTGALSAPGGADFTNNFFVQWGLAVRKKSGAGGNPRAQVHAAVSRSNG